MAIVALRTDLLVFALLAQVLGFSPSTASFRPTPRGGPKVQMPRQTQPQGTLSTSKSTFSLVESQPVATSPTSIGNAIVTLPPACEVVKSLLSVCNSISPGFTTFSYENQTRCLCYPNTTSWQPEIFDGAVATCAQDVSTIPSEYSQVASLEGFCLRSMAGCNVSTTGSCATPTPSGIGTISVIPFPSPTQTQLPSSSPGIQTVTNPDLTSGQKAGIGVGSFVVVSLAGYGLFAALRIKKPAEVNGGSEESGNVPSPQDNTTTTGAEKGLTLSESPEIHGTKLVVPRATTF